MYNGFSRQEVGAWKVPWCSSFSSSAFLTPSKLKSIQNSADSLRVERDDHLWLTLVFCPHFEMWYHLLFCKTFFKVLHSIALWSFQTFDRYCHIWNVNVFWWNNSFFRSTKVLNWLCKTSFNNQILINIKYLLKKINTIYLDGMGWYGIDGWCPGGVKYRAAYAANY